MKIALIAHDKKKNEIIELAKTYQEVLSHHELCATGTTGTLIMGETGLKIQRMKRDTRINNRRKLLQGMEIAKGARLSSPPANIGFFFFLWLNYLVTVLISLKVLRSEADTRVDDSSRRSSSSFNSYESIVMNGFNKKYNMLWRLTQRTTHRTLTRSIVFATTKT